MYDVQYFKKKFRAIPEEEWCIGIQDNGEGKRCAIGHCQRPEDFGLGLCYGDETEEGQALMGFQFLDPKTGWIEGIAYVNNGYHPKYQQPTPKQRVLAALTDLLKTNHTWTHNKHWIC